MGNNRGGAAAKVMLVILILIILAIFVDRSPFYLFPFGTITGVFHTVKDAINNGLCFVNGRLWGFPFSSAFSLIFFIIWIWVVVWVYRDAESRRMNGLLWALLVFIGNIIGLIIYLIIRNDYRQSVPESAAEPEEQKTPTCPKCDRPINRSFTFCPSCGKNLKNLCPNCQKEVQDDWQVCPHCGQKLKE